MKIDEVYITRRKLDNTNQVKRQATHSFLQGLDPGAQVIALDGEHLVLMEHVVDRLAAVFTNEALALQRDTVICTSFVTTLPFHLKSIANYQCKNEKL